MGTQFKMSKTFLFQANQFSQTVLIQAIQFSICIDFVYTQLNVKTVLFQIILFSVSTLVQFQCQKQVHFKQFNLAYKSVPFKTIQFSIHIDFVYTVKCQNSQILNNSV